MQVISKDPSSSSSSFNEERKCFIYIRVVFRTLPSQELRILGNISELGSWDLSKSLPLHTDSQQYPLWNNIFPLKVARETNLEFKFLIFEHGNFKEWEKLPLNGNRYYFSKFCKVCLEMREGQSEIRERVLMKFSSENEILPETQVFRNFGHRTKMTPFDLARETDSENSSDKMSDLIGDKLNPEGFDSSSFLSASKSFSESESDFEPEKIQIVSPLKELATQKKEKQTFSSLFEKYLKHYNAQKKKSHALLQKSTNFFDFLINFDGLAKNKNPLENYYKFKINEENKSVSEININPFQEKILITKTMDETSKKSSPTHQNQNSSEILIIVSFFPPLSWKNSHISTISTFESLFYNYLIFKGINFLWFCWSGIPPIDSKEEQRIFINSCLQKYSIYPIFLEKKKLKFFLQMSKSIHNIYQSRFDINFDEFPSFDLEFFSIFKEINKLFAKIIRKNTENLLKKKTNFFIFGFHLSKTPFYLRKSLSKQKKISKIQICLFLNDFPDDFYAKMLGNFGKVLMSMLFCDIISFSQYEFAHRFALDCEKLLKLQIKSWNGGFFYLEFQGKVILLQVSQIALPLELLDNEETFKIIEENNDFIILYECNLNEFWLVEYIIDNLSVFIDKYSNDSFKINVKILINCAKEQEKLEKLLKLKLNHQHYEIFSEENEIKERELYLRSNIFLSFSIQSNFFSTRILKYIYYKEDPIIIMNSANSSTFGKIFSTISKINLLSLNHYLFLSLQMSGSIQQKNKGDLDRIILKKNNMSKWLIKYLFLLDLFKFYENRELCIESQNIDFEGEILTFGIENKDYSEIDIKNVISEYKSSNNRVILLEYEAIFLDKSIGNRLNSDNILEIEYNLSGFSVNLNLLEQIKIIIADPLNSVFLISVLSPEGFHGVFRDCKELTILAENGFLGQKIGRDENYGSLIEKPDTSWKAIVKNEIMDFVSKTEGSYLVEKKYSLIWVFDKVDREFARLQSKELLNHLSEVLEFIDVIEISKYENFIEIRLKHCTQEIVAGLSIYESFFRKGPIDFLLCIASDQDFDQDLFSGVKNISKQKDAEELFDSKAFIQTCCTKEKISKANCFFKNNDDIYKLFYGLADSNKIKKQTKVTYQFSDSDS